MFIDNFFNQYGTTILYTVIMGIISYLGIILKRYIKRKYQERIKKEIIEVVCKAVEQLYSTSSNEDKLTKIIDNATRILTDKGIIVSDVELVSLIDEKKLE